MRLPTNPEFHEADRIGAQYGPGELIRRAAMQVRCADCAGLIIAGITYIDGRPHATLREMNDPLAPERGWLGRHWQFGWADRGVVLKARCRVRRHVLPLDDLYPRLRGPGKPRIKITVTHDQPRS